jgi:hypothetical protein
MEENTEQGPAAGSETERTLEGGPTRVAAITSIASGALVFAIAGLPSGATAATKSQTLDGSQLLASLERAGMNPRALNLKQLLGPRPDLAELQARLTGTKLPGAAQESKWPDVTIVIFQKA